MDNKEITRWLEKADYDLKTAEAMQTSRRYIYVLFCCQQALEKLIKAIIIKKTGELAPRIHNLVILMEKAELELEPAQVSLLRELSDIYVRTRYPLTIDLKLTKQTGEKYLKATKEIYQWLLTKMS